MIYLPHDCLVEISKYLDFNSYLLLNKTIRHIIPNLTKMTHQQIMYTFKDNDLFYHNCIPEFSHRNIYIGDVIYKSGKVMRNGYGLFFWYTRKNTELTIGKWINDKLDRSSVYKKTICETDKTFTERLYDTGHYIGFWKNYNPFGYGVKNYIHNGFEYYVYSTFNGNKKDKCTITVKYDISKNVSSGFINPKIKSFDTLLIDYYNENESVLSFKMKKDRLFIIDNKEYNLYYSSSDILTCCYHINTILFNFVYENNLVSMSSKIIDYCYLQSVLDKKVCSCHLCNDIYKNRYKYYLYLST